MCLIESWKSGLGYEVCTQEFLEVSALVTKVAMVTMANWQCRRLQLSFILLLQGFFPNCKVHVLRRFLQRNGNVFHLLEVKLKRPQLSVRTVGRTHHLTVVRNWKSI
jgi:hypothetical protein